MARPEFKNFYFRLKLFKVWVIYQFFKDNCPPRPKLEEIAKKTGLRRRVVQVWFQNTRARERKGQYRAVSQFAGHKKPRDSEKEKSGQKPPKIPRCKSCEKYSNLNLLNKIKKYRRKYPNRSEF